jgi:MYXO-CTERM domain-containing protein
VNQAAERIIFADNGDGTVTAVIQIMYEGPAENFSWLLPISSAPASDDDIGVASDLAFQRLQAATNPQYSLQTVVEGTCRQQSFPGAGGTGSVGVGGSSGGSGGGAGMGSGPGVVVEASGVVGSFEWVVISLDPDLPEPAAAAITWLGDNGYDVPSGAETLLGPYLADGLNLLALKLTKGSDTGSIRPIMLTYEAERPAIPIKLTAVAANEDMGVMTWVLSNARAVPQNYLSLELNEARINWFNPASNYNDVVIAAADDAQGQGFVTEFAGASSAFANVVWTAYDQYGWDSFSTGVYSSFDQIFNQSYNRWNTWDGYWDAVEEAVTLPDTVAFADFKLCPSCYSDQIEFSPSTFVAALEEHVIRPVRAVQELIDAHEVTTRLYTTLSAAEMTLDPIFTFNPDLDDVSNVHTARRIIECNPNVYQSEANWRIELPQGGVIRGTPQDVGVWPVELGDQPPNRQIIQAAESGPGRVLDDQSDTINSMLDEYNATVPAAVGSSGGSGGASGGSPATGGSGATGGAGGLSGTSGGSAEGGGCGCAVPGGSDRSSAVWAALMLAAGLYLRRRPRSRP